MGGLFCDVENSISVHALAFVHPDNTTGEILGGIPDPVDLAYDGRSARWYLNLTAGEDQELFAISLKLNTWGQFVIFHCQPDAVCQDLARVNFVYSMMANYTFE